MNKFTSSLLAAPALFAMTIVFASGCADFNDPYRPSSSYPPYGGYGGGYDSGYYNDREYRREQERLERERDRLHDERRRLEQERREQERRDADRYRPPPPPPRQESCPPGFSPSENKCSPQERRNGCRDIRLPGGLGCVSR